MKIIVGKDFEEMSDISASILLGKMCESRRVNLAITAGKTPEKIYQILVKKTKGKNFDNVHYYNFDEGHANGNPYGITMSELKEQYLDPSQVHLDNIHPMTMENFKDWDKKIASDGGLDLIMMGIGEDGHFCANLPGTNTFTDLNTKLLTFDFPEGKMEFATMGAQSVLSAKQVLLIANGKHKAEILKKALFGPVTEDVPASVLKLHPNFTVVLDEEAASSIIDLL